MATRLRLLLANNPVFASLDTREREELIESGRKHLYHKGEWVTHYGDVWPYLFIIDEGSITALKQSQEGRSLLVAQFGPGELFWGLAFFDEAWSTPAALSAAVDSQLYLWSREALLPLLMRNGQMSWELTRLMVSRMLRASDIVEGLAFLPVAGRLAAWLLDWYQDAVDEFVARDMTLDEIASRNGTTREMVCRLLYRFAEEGAVEVNRTEFKISNPDVLRGYLSVEMG